MTHASVSEAERAVLGITDNMIRLSVGIEEIDDLKNDIDQALKAAVSYSTSSTLLNLKYIQMNLYVL